jgi:hypothetical protein
MLIINESSVGAFLLTVLYLIYLVGKSATFTKILSQHDVHKREFSWVHLFAKIGVLIQASKRIDSKIRNEFEFEIQTTRHL